MTHHDGDAELVRNAIAELRAADTIDSRAGDSFAAMLRRVPARRNRRVTARTVLLAASVVALAVVGYRVADVQPTPPPLELPREVAALSAWRPMTDPLLETPGRELLRGGRPLGTSILDLNLNGALR
jgi:hypothetical protein